MQPIILSTVTPVYSGEAYLEALVAEMNRLRTAWESDNGPVHFAEAIFVDDAARDNSPKVLARLAKQYPWIRVITLSRNFGQHSATVAGILHSSGDWIVTLDEDLQHPPANIVDLLRAAVDSNADVVYGRPEKSVHSGWFRDLSSRAYKRCLAFATDNDAALDFSSFRLIRGSVARATSAVCGHETYFDVALSWFTDRYRAVRLPLHDRRTMQGGASGYSVRRLLSHARKAIVSSHSRLLRLSVLLGGVAVVLAATFGTRALVLRLQGNFADVRGWTSLFVSVLFFGGVACLLLGVVLEYLVNVVLHTQGKPPFFVVDRTSDELVSAWFRDRQS